MELRNAQPQAGPFFIAGENGTWRVASLSAEPLALYVLAHGGCPPARRPDPTYGRVRTTHASWKHGEQYSVSTLATSMRNA